MIVYLCGGINGLSDAECRDWREVAKELLHAETLDPMRRDYRGKEDESVDEIVRGDLDDIKASDVVLVNATRPSWGTAMEIAYAAMLRKQIVAFTGDASVRISPWLRYHVGHLRTASTALLCVTVEDAVRVVNGFVSSREVSARQSFALDNGAFGPAAAGSHGHGSVEGTATATPRAGVDTLPRDPVTGRNFDGYFDHRFECGCVDFYHGGVGRCGQHA